MKCPRCDQETIEFRMWCRSPNAFIWRCIQCGVSLKASRATWTWFGILLFLVLLVVGAVIYLEEAGVIVRGGGKIYLLIGIGVIVGPLSYVAYKRGGYQTRASAP